ncbi:MAG: DUF2807 domain-containing protein [Sphingomicrobium sp.]
MYGAYGPMRIHLAAMSLASLAAPAAAADRNFTVSSFDRIRVDGPYRVRLTVGVPPFASARGGAQALDGLAIDIQGRTLVIHNNRTSWGGYSGESIGPVEVSLGTHELTAAWLNGSGSLAINEAQGLSFDLSVMGSGSASIDRVAVDQLHVGLGGSATARLAGSALRMTAFARGNASLDAAALATKDVVIAADGPSVVKATASDTAKVDAIGVAAVTLGGNPSCIVRAKGSATVEGCR